MARTYKFKPSSKEVNRKKSEFNRTKRRDKVKLRQTAKEYC